MKTDIHTLPPDLARNLSYIESYLQSVDFTHFVAELMEGVFTAILKSTKEQREAYGKLVEEVSATISEFKSDNIDGAAARDWLSASDEDDEEEEVGVARSRQQLLATMVLMGLNGIMVTHARVCAVSTRALNE